MMDLGVMFKNQPNLMNLKLNFIKVNLSENVQNLKILGDGL